MIFPLSRYLVDGVFQHDPLYPTESDTNGNINNVVVIGQDTPTDQEATKHDVLSLESSADESNTFKGVAIADVANLVAKEDAGTDRADITELQQSVCDSKHSDQGSMAATEKAEIISNNNIDSITVDCSKEGKIIHFNL